MQGSRRGKGLSEGGQWNGETEIPGSSGGPGRREDHLRHKLIRKGRHGCCYPSPAKPVIFLPLLKCSYHQARHLKFLTAFTAAGVPKLKPMLDCLWNWSFQANCRDHTRPGCVHRRGTKRRRQLIWGCAGAWHPASVVSCWGCGALNPLILGNTPREVLHTHHTHTLHTRFV